MSRYFTRLKMKRCYKWGGRPSLCNRKFKSCYYDSLYVSTDGQRDACLIQTGQHILVEGDDDDKPYVAKLLKLFGDDKGKWAEVQWFVHFSEVPYNRRKLLGRTPHPQEIFLYEDRTCDGEIDAETIIGSVEVEHLPPDASFPETGQKGTLYFKLCWDTKAFKVVDAEGRHLDDKTPLVSVSVAPTTRVLPTPDATVMKRALSVTLSRVSASAGKLAASEVESGHSASKLSASKFLSRRRRGSCDSTPGVRKKLDLNSPNKKLTTDDVLGELLNEEIESQTEMARKLQSTPSKLPLQEFNLSPLKSSNRPSNGMSMTPLRSQRPPSPSPHTPPDHTSAKARTPSQKKDPVSAIKEPALGSLAEELPEVSEQTDITPRSKRKSARLVSSRIRKQLNLLNAGEDQVFEDDSGDECFVPSKKDAGSTSEDEESGQAESEDEGISVKKRRLAASCRTPRSSRKAPASARTPHKSSSKKVVSNKPRTPRHATPGIPSRSLPARKPGNVLEEARARLHVSSVPDSLPCREQEFQDIYSFVESKIVGGNGGCMYISGVPGTGKTATVHEVIRCLQHASEQDELPSFRFIEINGMKMTDPHQAYVQILQKLTNQKATADHAAALLEKRFSNPAPQKETTVLLVDELDLLWTKKQNVMYNLFDWPTRRYARLVVLAIANTMDLPERIMINRVASRLGLTRMSFQPYSFKQLQQIITSRLNQVKAFEEDAVQLVSRKVAALSGDARRCLDICRRATEICEHSSSRQPGSGLVGMAHVMEALDEMFSSSYISAIRCASTQEQLFLRAVIAEFRRLGLEEATFQQVFVQHRALCRMEGLQPISVSEGLAVCQRLGTSRILLLEPSRLDLLLRVRLNVSQDDVLYALKED
ncbi:origin recognition complex subunit 1 [Scleropages formosus]|uniref:origin recognition complex subunit 1 n=1 Tax=Scleropages formosus TaxID=113540 RepID=UPI0010FA6A4C|nr:origin recognition complex subunit 1 [Scleropages formosus]